MRSHIFAVALSSFAIATIPSLSSAQTATAGARAAAATEARAFQVAPDGGSRIQFVSDAPLETITGVTSNVSGEIRINPARLAGSTGTVRVNIASIRTGIDLRDEHLRGAQWLDAEHFENATFELSRIEGATSLAPNTSTRVRLRGRFTLHGQSKEIVAQGSLRYVPSSEASRAAGVTGDALMGQFSFRVSLEDYGVSVPAIYRVKIANEIEVNLTLRAVAPAAAN